MSLQSICHLDNALCMVVDSCFACSQLRCTCFLIEQHQIWGLTTCHLVHSQMSGSHTWMTHLAPCHVPLPNYQRAWVLLCANMCAIGHSWPSASGLRRLWAGPCFPFFLQQCARLACSCLQEDDRMAQLIRDRGVQPTSNTSVWACLGRLTDHKTGALVTPEVLAINTALVFLAGYETTAFALTWALFELAAHPHLQVILLPVPALHTRTTEYQLGTHSSVLLSQEALVLASCCSP